MYEYGIKWNLLSVVQNVGNPEHKNEKEENKEREKKDGCETKRESDSH